jgi:membrane protein required for colicin V production
LVPYAKKYTDDDRIAIVGSAAVVFLIALIVISFITMKIADFIIDSRIGALDRTLGFLFGAARGILLLVVAVAFWNWLVDADHRPGWVNNAKSKPFLDSMVVKLQSVLPEEFAQMVRTSVMDKVLPPSENTGNANAPAADQAPADDAAPAAPAAPAQPQSN